MNTTKVQIARTCCYKPPPALIKNKTVRNVVCVIMSNAELQEEEKEVLLSIYEGDNRFKNISSSVYQYKYGEDNDPKSFLLEISWTENYPTEKPKVNMDMFYNKHITSDVKEKIVNCILSEAEQYLGAAMTYTLFEFVKEKEQEFTEFIPEKIICAEDSYVNSKKQLVNEQENDDSKRIVQRKIHLTKAQKRRQWDRIGSGGEKPRGWNWVDLVKHLSQTDHKSSNESELQNN